LKSYACIALATALLAPLKTAAAPADYVYTPDVEYGEKEIDFKAGTARKQDNPGDSASSIGFGYGAKEWWFTEIYVKHVRENGEGTKLDAFEWENKFQLTEPGEHPIDVGVLLEIERPRNHAEGWEMKWGPLFQVDIGKVQLNANTLIQRNYRADGPAESDFMYQWQAKYRWTRAFEFGVQGFGETGKWNHWALPEERTHRTGPAVFGKLPLGNGQAVKYNAAVLFAAAKAAPDHTLRMQVEYEFR
jgi:hypothetical protein